MADFEIEDDDNDFSFSSGWNSKKPSRGGMFGGGGGDEDDMYDFEIEDVKPINKSKRGTSFSPGSSSDSNLSPKKPEPKTIIPTRSSQNDATSALERANSMLAKYAAKPAASSGTAKTNPFAKKKYSTEFDEDDISVESDDVEDFELSESSGPPMKGKAAGRKDADKSAPLKKDTEKKVPAKSNFEMSNSYDDASLEDSSKKPGKALASTGSKQPPTASMIQSKLTACDDDEDDDSYKPQASKKPVTAPPPSKATSTWQLVQSNTRRNDDDDSLYKGSDEEVEEDFEDESAVMEESMLEDSAASGVGGNAKGRDVQVSYTIKQSVPVLAAQAPAVAGKTSSVPSADYSVEFEDDFEEDLNERYGVELGGEQDEDDDNDEYSRDSVHESSEEEERKPSAPRVMNFSDLNDIAGWDVGQVAPTVEPMPAKAQIEPVSSPALVPTPATIPPLPVPKSSVQVIDDRRIVEASKPSAPANSVRSTVPPVASSFQAHRYDSALNEDQSPPSSSSRAAQGPVVSTNQPSASTPSAFGPAVSLELPSLNYSAVDPARYNQAAAPSASIAGTVPSRVDNGLPIGNQQFVPAHIQLSQAQASTGPINQNLHQSLPMPVPQFAANGLPPPTPAEAASLQQGPYFQAALQQQMLQQQQQQLLQQQMMQQHSLYAGHLFPAGMDPYARSPYLGNYFGTLPPPPAMSPYYYPSPLTTNPYLSSSMPNPILAQSLQALRSPLGGMPTSASNLLAQSMPGFGTAGASPALMSDPMVLDLLRELKDAKEDATWAKNKLAEMIVLVHNKAENEAKLSAAASLVTESSVKDKAVPTTSNTKSKVSPRSAPGEANAYASDEFDDEYSNDFDDNPASSGLSTSVSKGKPPASSKPATSPLISQPTLRSLIPVSANNITSDFMVGSASNNSTYPLRSSALFRHSADIDLTSTLSTSQALFRRQLQSLRDRLNISTGNFPNWSNPYAGSEFDATKLTPYTTMLSALTKSKSESKSDETPEPNPSRVEPDLQFRTDMPLSASTRQLERQNKLWEMILQSEPHLGEIRAKELAIKYASALE